MAAELFKKDELNFVEFLLPEEKILALDGFHANIFVGTNFGRLCHFKMVDDFWILEKSLSTLNHTPIEQVLVTTALGYIMIVSEKTLFFIDLDIYRIVSSSGEGHVGIVALNTDPVTDNPFILQIAVVVTTKEIWVCEKFEDSFDTKHKVSINSPILAMYYTRYCLCYATEKEYFVRDLLSKTTHSLFPFEGSVMRPIITGVGSVGYLIFNLSIIFKEEVVVSGMQGLVIFANKDGVSSRPPIFVGSESIQSIGFVAPFLFVLTDDALHVYNIENQQLKQTIKLDDATFISNIDGTIFSVHKAGLSKITSISWVQQVEEKMKIDIKSGLELAKELIASSNLETNYSAMQKFKEFQEKAAFAYLQEGDEEEAYTLLISSEADPKKVINRVQETSDHSEKVMDHFKISLRFAENYLSDIRSHEWAAFYAQEIDTALARIYVLTGKIEELSRLETTDWNTQEYRQWLQAKNHFNLTAELAFETDCIEEAFEIWRKLAQSELSDPSFDSESCFGRLKAVQDEKIWLDVLGWLVPTNPECAMKAVMGFNKLPVDEVLTLFEPYPSVLLPYIRKIVSQTNDLKDCSLSTIQLHSKLFELYIVELKTRNSTNAEKLADILRDFRTFIFDSDYCDVDHFLGLIGDDKNLTVESLLVKAKKGDPQEIMKMLVHMDLPAAELLCTRLPAHSSTLLPILLNAYSKLKKPSEDVRKRISTILSRLDSSIDPKEVLKDLPEDMKCSDVTDFLKRSMTHSNNRITSNRMRATLEQKIIEEMNVRLSKSAYHSFVIDEDTVCRHCSQPLGKDVIVLYPESRKLAHKSCYTAQLHMAES